MDKDLQLIGLGIAFLIGFGLVTRAQKKELQELGKVINAISAILAVAHAVDRLGS
jgi:uncharacterized protein YgfB (UPF0149 family)